MCFTEAAYQLLVETLQLLKYHFFQELLLQSALYILLR